MTNQQAQRHQSQFYQVCPQCGFSRNQPEAIKCKICKHPLSPKRETRKRIALALAGALSLSGIGAISWLCLSQNSDAEGKTELLGNSQQQALAPKLPSDLQTIYKTMRSVPNVPAGTYNYGGALLFAPLRSPLVIDAIARAHPQFKLRYVEPLSGPGSRKAVAMLIDGQLSFSQAAQPVKDEEYQKAVERGFKLQEVPVAINAVVFFTNVKMKIPGLSVDQLRNIYTGKIKNWQQVNGPDLPIVPITLNPKDSSTMRLLTEDLPGGINNVRAFAVRDYTECIRQVSANLGGISFGSASTVMGQKSIRPVPIAKEKSSHYVNVFTQGGTLNPLAVIDGSYPIAHRVSVVIRRDGTPDEIAGVAYANLLRSGEGQRLIEQKGFVPLFGTSTK